jgi:hypothetical protein
MKSRSFNLIVILALFLSLLGSSVTVIPVYALGPGLGWTFQRTITLSAPTPSANFQIRVQITDHSNMNATDGRDLRFYDASDVQADYWIETWNPAGTSTIWVEVPTGGSGSLKMYYGNAGASAVSNGDNTFIAFDDFSGSSVNTSKWDAKDTNASIAVSGGSVTLISGPAGQGDQLINKMPFTVSTGIVVESVMSSNVIARCAARTSSRFYNEFELCCLVCRAERSDRLCRRP